QESAVGLYERSVDLFTSLGDRRGLANALAVMMVCGPSHHASGGAVRRSVHAIDLLTNERAVRLATEIGWRAGEAFSRFLLADALAWRGEYQRALRLARESLAIAQEIEHLEWQGGARRVLGVIALELFALPEALAQLEAAHEIARRLASATWIRWTGAPLAIAYARAGDCERATAVLDGVERTVSPSAQTAIGPAESAGRSASGCWRWRGARWRWRRGSRPARWRRSPTWTTPTLRASRCCADRRWRRWTARARRVGR
ncbi:MAG: tetratricopeptide repeat protein, partial [Gemmatimonadota bacterium]